MAQMRRPDEHRRGGFSSEENLELDKAGARFLTYSWTRDSRNILYHSKEVSTGGHWKVTLEWPERRRVKEGEL